MITIALVWAGALILMLAVLTWFSDDLLDEQRKIRENFISRRKTNLRKISLGSETGKELVKTVNKSFLKKRTENVEKLIAKADMKITYVEYLIISIFFGIIGYIIGQGLNNFAISITLAFITYTIPKSYLKFISGSLKRQINDQLEPVLSQIIGLLPTKKTLINSVETCLENMEEPLKTLFTEFVNNVNNANRPFDEAINELAKKIDSKPFYDFARLAMVHYRQGGETMYAFSTIPETMRDMKLIQSEQETELDSLKLVGYMFVMAAPLSFLYYYFTDKTSFNILINTMPGKIVSFIALVITIITVKLITNISKPIEL